MDNEIYTTTINWKSIRWSCIVSWKEEFGCKVFFRKYFMFTSSNQAWRFYSKKAVIDRKRSKERGISFKLAGRFVIVKFDKNIVREL